jgi:hypothetical protein
MPIDDKVTALLNAFNTPPLARTSMDFVFTWQGESDADKRFFEGLMRIVAGYVPVDVQDEQLHSLKVVVSLVVYILTDCLSEEPHAHVPEPTQVETSQVLRCVDPV